MISPVTRSLAFAALLGGLCCLLPAPAARAQTFTWDGGGASNNWGDANNWLTNLAPTSSVSTQLIFTGSTRLTPVQNIGSPFLLNALTFDANAGAFSLTGNALDFRVNGTSMPALTQASAAAQTMGNTVNLSANLLANVTSTGGLFLTGVVTGAGGLAKVGAGTMTLSNTNSYAGGTIVVAGRLVALNNGNALATGSVNIGGGAAVELANTTANIVGVAGGTTFSGTGTLVKSGSGAVAFGGNGGNVVVGLGAGASIDVQGGTLSGSSTGQGFFTGNLAGLNIAAGATFNGVEGTIQVDALTGAGTLRGGFGGTRTTTIGVNNGTGMFSGVIADNTAQSGVLALTKTGSGLQILNGTNTYSGTTTVSGGTLFVGNGDAAGTLGSGSVVNNAELAFYRSDAITVANVISGSGALTQAGAGALTLSSANTYGGGIDLNAGSLGAGNNAAFGPGSLDVFATNGRLFAAGADRALANAVSLAAGTTLNVVADPAGAHNLTLNGVISGAGGLSVNVSGASVTLGGSAANTFTGVTSVTAGTLVLNKNNGVPAVGGNLAIGNAANPGAASSVVVRQNSGNQIGSATNVTVFQDGQLDLNGRDTNIGTLTLTGGLVSGGDSILSLYGDVTVNSSAVGSRITSTDFLNDLNLRNTARTFTVARGTATYDLDVQAGVYIGTLVKAGPGTLRLAGNRNNSLSVTLNAGTVAVATDAALGSDGGTFTVAGGTVVADGADRTVSNAVNVTANATVGSSVDGTPRALTFTGAASLAAGATLTVSSNAGTTFSGVVSGAGGIVKTGTGTLTLGNTANTFTGGLTLNGGALAVSGDGSLGASTNVVSLNAGSLQFTGNTTTARTFNLNNAVTLGVAAGTTLTYASGASVNGGFLGAGGTHAFTDGSALNGTTALIGSTLTQSGTVAFNNATVRGTFTQAAGATLNATNGLNVTGSGTVTANGTVNLANGGESLGRVVVNPGGAVNVGGNALYLNAGSRTTIGSVGAPGGALAAASGASVELAGQLVNNGTQTGALNVNFGGLAKGAGSFGAVNVGDGGKFSPGNSPGTANAASFTLGAGSRYEFEISNTAADLLNVSGTLTLSAGTTANSRLVVALFTLDGSNNPATLTTFDATQQRTFLLATAGGGIVGFDPNEATVDRTGFLNDPQGGTFTVLQQGNNLVVQFVPVPEPGTWALLLVGGGLAWAAAGGRRFARRAGRVAGR